RPQTSKARARRAGRSAPQIRGEESRSRASAHHEVAEGGAGRLPFYLEVTGVHSLERLRDDLARLGVEMDVVAMQVHLAVGVAGDVDGHGVVVCGLEVARRHG